MKLSLVLVLLVCQTICTEWFNKNNPVFLNSQNVKGALEEPGYAKVVKFFTPWCSYCRKLKPVVDNQKVEMKESGVKVKFYDLNCEQYAGICNYFNVHQYPRILFFDDVGNLIGEIDGFYAPPYLIDMLQQYIKIATKNIEAKDSLAQTPSKSQKIQQKAQVKPLQKSTQKPKELRTDKSSSKIENDQKDKIDTTEKITINVEEKNIQTHYTEKMTEMPPENPGSQGYEEKLKKIFMCILITLIGFSYLKQLLKIEPEKAKKFVTTDCQKVNTIKS